MASSTSRPTLVPVESSIYTQVVSKSAGTEIQESVIITTLSTEGHALATIPVTTVIPTHKQTSIPPATSIGIDTDASGQLSFSTPWVTYTPVGTTAEIPESVTTTIPRTTTTDGHTTVIPVTTVVPNPKFVTNSPSSGKKKGPTSTVIIIIGVLLGCLFLCIALLIWRYRRLRRLRQFQAIGQVDPLDLQEAAHYLEPLGDNSITHRNALSLPPHSQQTSKAPPQRRKGIPGVFSRRKNDATPEVQHAVEENNRISDIILTAAAETTTDRRGDERLDNQEINLIASRVAEILRSTDRHGRSSAEDMEGAVGGIAQRSSSDRRKRVSRSDSSILPPSEAPPTYRE